jgi:hypothetical protein
MVAGVQAFFTARGVTANVSLGWKEASKQVNQGAGRANRVVFIPSDRSGRGGALKLDRNLQPGQRHFGSPVKDASAKALYTWERLLTVSVWAVDSTAPNDEGKQIEAVEDLFEWTIRAVHDFAHASAQWGEVAWLATPIERQFGRELQASLVFRHPMFDTPQDRAFPGFDLEKVPEPI